ncbi:phage holin [Cytobacillus kochii]|uniref:phage holin n=1 Tax=Cytobacillus kochii TaxID=859143 RepID=UPI0025A1C22A|nr:phage holin [Cytobacillus kochii]MDM5208411.1 phage holin [Cytobacillus kochii]
MNKDVVAQVVGFLSAIMMFLGTLNVKFEWLTAESIDAFGIVLTAGIALGITLYTIYKNHFGFTKKAKQQKAWLEKADKL